MLGRQLMPLAHLGSALRLINMAVSKLCEDSQNLPGMTVRRLSLLQNALNFAARVGGQLYKAAEAQGDSRDHQVRTRGNTAIRL